MRTLIVAIMALFMGSVANAAEFYVTTNGDNQTVIYMNGDTVDGDLDRFLSALDEARNTKYMAKADVVVDGEVVGQTEVEKTREFSNEIWLEGPGGAMFEGIGVAWKVREQGLNTRAVGRCASACSMIFLAGVERELDYAGTVGFHFPYVPDTEGLDWIKNNFGWYGVQDNMNRTSALFLAYLLYFGVDHDFYLMLQLSRIEGTKELFWINHTNFGIIGDKGRVH